VVKGRGGSYGWDRARVGALCRSGLVRVGSVRFGAGLAARGRLWVRVLLPHFAHLRGLVPLVFGQVEHVQVVDSNVDSSPPLAEVKPYM
jgi:hypothetical protein